MTTRRNVVTIDNVKAKLLIHERRVLSDSELVEMKIWQVPVSVDPSRHNYKYSLVYISDGVRLVGFDNERGKGDHVHLDGHEYPYGFKGVDRLVEDFIAEIEKRRS
ncbi:toxin-antitoxin system TumE family protein [Sedimenticola hydrogenitrophicus]|uniref:toxin-antitoxin system TumE family protein n=1 Tax=Sedimenticola hydrogenitrophicus TaxID=2967975 RepID=UPI0023AFD65E|nr:DUF6516 family protein [Sedimenticola hydrogenitrophicus]